MAEIREVREGVVVKRRPASGVAAFAMFLVGGLVIGIVALVLLDVHGTISWPAGHVDLALKPAVTASNTQPVTAIPVTAPLVTVTSTGIPAATSDAPVQSGEAAPVVDSTSATETPALQSDPQNAETRDPQNAETEAPN